MTHREQGTALALLIFAVMAALFFVGAPSPAEGNERIELPGFSAPDGYHKPSSATLRATEAEGCVAEVYMKNNPVNGTVDNGTYQMWSDSLGVSVNLTFTYNVFGTDNDVFEFEVPVGLVAVPPVQSLAETTDAVTLICLDRGVGS